LSAGHDQVINLVSTLSSGYLRATQLTALSGLSPSSQPSTSTSRP
jgi:hypothetical protein